MGSRAIVALCRSNAVARHRFGITGVETGAIWTRTGRPFFSDSATTEGLLARLRTAADHASLWDQLETDWLLLDAEIMPWSAKAGALIQSQYAPVAVSSRAGLHAAVSALSRASTRGVPALELEQRFAARAARAGAYATAWAPYVWPVSGVDDLRVAPFHILASEGNVWLGKDHVWHMEMADRLAATGDRVVAKTRWRVVALTDESACAEAVRWWEDMTQSGGEGMVVKPRSFVAQGAKGLLQPALAACAQGARPRISAHHLWAGIRAHRSPPRARSRRQAQPCLTRIRARP
jgi:protein phosphatase